MFGSGNVITYIKEFERMQVKPIILCGGSGTRLWPVSRQLLPKQLLALGSTDTMLQATALRTSSDQFEAPIIVAGEDHRFLVQEQLEQTGIAPEAIILEPSPRSTAPAIGVVAARQAKVQPDQLLLAMPSDQIIGDVDKFLEAVTLGSTAAAEGYIVAFGIKPSRPDTGFGYIEAGEELGFASGIHRVAKFYEKPDLAMARKFVSGGSHFWNGGIFLFQAGAMLDELREHAPSIAAACEKAASDASIDGKFVRPAPEVFKTSPSLSIDYAVMEKTQKAVVVPVAMDWSDVGSWNALWELSGKDRSGNVLSDNVVTIDSEGCFLRTDSETTIAAIGVQDLVVVATRDAILVVPRVRSQDAGQAVKALREAGIHKDVAHPRVIRPWGSYEVVDKGERFQTKRIIVKPGGVLSLQLHHQRAEHWVVVSGTARITIDGQVRLLQENESTFVPAGTTHRLENPGKIALHLIEIQCGPYLGEDDIVRLEDNYGRASVAGSPNADGRAG